MDSKIYCLECGRIFLLQCPKCNSVPIFSIDIIPNHFRQKKAIFSPTITTGAIYCPTCGNICCPQCKNAIFKKYSSD